MVISGFWPSVLHAISTICGWSGDLVRSVPWCMSVLPVIRHSLYQGIVGEELGWGVDRCSLSVNNAVNNGVDNVVDNEVDNEVDNIVDNIIRPLLHCYQM